MELPIRIILTLLVTLAVAGALLIFSRNVIDDAKRQLQNIGDVPKEQIIDKGDAEVTASEIVYLAEECYRQQKESLIEGELCFVVTGSKVSASPADLMDKGIDKLPNFDASLIAQIDGASSVGIYYDAAKDTVAISRW